MASLALVLVVSGCVQNSFVEINGKKIAVEVADTPAEREKGLMFRERLCDDCGMLFVFEDEGKHSFWMKDTLIPLEIIFIDANGIIADILPAEPCVEDPCEMYTPSKDALYVLEVAEGIGKEHSFAVGQKVLLSLT